MHMSAYTNIEAFLHREVIFLVDSTLYSAVYASAITISTIILTQNLFSWTLVLLPFFGCILIYSMNRLTDKEEDAINQPGRIRFPRRIRITFLVVSLVFYVLLEDIVFQKNFLTFAIALVPVIIAILYSIFRLKRFFLVKNLSIAMALGASVLIVPAYYDNWSGIWGWLFLFFFLIVLTNSILFDFKDIRGDRACGIHTLPVILGFPATRYFCYALIAAAFIVIIPLMLMNRESILLIPCAGTIALSTIYAPESENPPWWYFGVLVEGEMWILLFTTLFLMIL